MKCKSLIKLVVGIIVIGGGLSYFMLQAMQSSWSYYYSVDDFIEGSESVKNSSLRLAGKVKPGTINRNIENAQLSFILQGEKSELPIKYAGMVPDNFTEDIEVVVEGRLDPSGSFDADTLMTKCESKYKAKVN